MKKYILILLIFVLNLSISSQAQIFEKINLIVSGGAAYPQESFIANPFVFQQLDTAFQEMFGKKFGGVYFRQDTTGTNFKKYWKTGFNIGTGLEFEINQYITSILLFQYQQFAFNMNELATGFENALDSVFNEFPIVVSGDTIPVPFNTGGFDVQNGTVKIYTISLNLKGQYHLPYVTPYLMAGGGYMWLFQEPIDINYYDEPLSAVPLSISFFDRIPSEKVDAFMVNVGGGLYFNKWQSVKPFVEVQYNLGFTQKVDLEPTTEGNQKSFNTKYYAIKVGFIFNLK